MGNLSLVFQAGQFVVLRLHLDAAKPPVLRSYSLSDLPAADHFRISVKNESNGIGSSFLCNRTKEGDALDVSAPRGSFTLRPSQNPVVLLSAGVGATPVMSMLHALAAENSQQEIWWIYGARNSADHPFAEESRSLLNSSLVDADTSSTAGPLQSTKSGPASMLPVTLTRLC